MAAVELSIEVGDRPPVVAVTPPPQPSPAPETGPLANLDELPWDDDLGVDIPRSLSERHHAEALGRRDGKLVVAMLAPGDLRALDDLRAVVGCLIEPVAVDEAQLETIRVLRLGTTAKGLPAAAPPVVSDLGPAAQFVDDLVAEAVARRASDIHLEPSRTGLRVRLRVDGVLVDASEAPESIRSGVVNRLKILADIDISEHRRALDGRATVRFPDGDVDLRVATVPTPDGEALVIRLLRERDGVDSLPGMGFLPDTLDRYRHGFRLPSGLVLVTGPTGAGKTTTLHATLHELNDPFRSIVTVEDPIEYRLRGAKQVQPNVKAGFTFAGALRAVLRLDPDVLLVGEIRDRETACIAAEASLTGQLVLASVHTNDAASTPVRLIELGVDPYVLASTLRVVVAQRLVRRLCTECSRPSEGADREVFDAEWQWEALMGEQEPQPRFAVGCRGCRGTGYLGRIGLHEVMVLSVELAELVTSGARSDRVQQQAMAEGMRTMRQDGLRKVAAGLTTMQDLGRVVG